jgi:acylphosphatase
MVKNIDDGKIEFFFAGKSTLKKKRKHLWNTKKNTFFYKYEKLKNQNFSSLPMISTTPKIKQSLKRLDPKPQALH